MIKVEHLTKYYGDFLAVDDLSFEIEDGEVYGFLGPNGAGKSTTMNIMTGSLSATYGTVTIGGMDIYEEPEAAKKLIGYLPEIPPLYVNETPDEYLRFVGEAKGLKGQELKDQIEKAVEEAGISHVRNRLISSLSKGYRQRVGIAQALLGDPEVIILDEPTVGLDPIQIIEIRDLIRKLGENHTVILSSHILSEVQAICGRVIIIAGGKLVANDTPENLETVLTKSNGITFKVLASKEETDNVLTSCDAVNDWQSEAMDDGSVSVSVLTEKDDIREVCCSLFFSFADAKLPIFEMNSAKANLEDVFIELTENAQTADDAEDAVNAEDAVDAENVIDAEEAVDTEDVASENESEVAE